MTTTYFDDVQPPPARTTTRPTVTYAEYVKDYAKSAAWHGMAIFGGVALVVGAAIRLDGWPMLAVIGFGFGLAGGGTVGLWATMTAHALYSRLLATSSTVTYQAAPPAGAQVRPFVPSTNGSATIRAGRFALTQRQWLRLFQSAADGGKLTRDAAVKALPRQYYRDWSNTLAELGRLGFVDGGGVITDAGWKWYAANVSPYSHDGNASPCVLGTHAPAARGAHEVQS